MFELSALHDEICRLSQAPPSLPTVSGSVHSMMKFADNLGLPHCASLPTVSGSAHPMMKFADSRLGLPHGASLPTASGSVHPMMKLADSPFGLPRGASLPAVSGSVHPLLFRVRNEARWPSIYALGPTVRVAVP